MEFINKFLNVCPFDCKAIAGSGKGGAIKPQINHIGLITVVALVGRPKSVRNSCIIERICSVFLSFHLCIVCHLGVFVIRLRQIFSRFSLVSFLNLHFLRQQPVFCNT